MKEMKEGERFILLGFPERDFEKEEYPIETSIGLVNSTPQAYGVLIGHSRQELMNPVGEEWMVIKKTSRISGEEYLTVRKIY